MNLRAITRISLVLCLFASAAFAEGPLNVGGPSDAEGKPFLWNPANFPLQYWTDQGSLGSRTNTQANAIAAGALQTWQDVNTASITFALAGSLGANVTAANYVSVENAINSCSNVPALPPGGVAKPVSVIYDTDGSIIDATLGVGQSNSILGFAYPTCLTSDGTNNFYNRGLALMNGKGTTDAELDAIMIHEFGHMLGLDHSQVNVECNPAGCFDADAASGLPTMFPILVDEAEMSTPATDDIAGISALYPETVNDPPNGKVPFVSTTGRITGQIFFSDGVTPAQSINVVARVVDDPATTNIDESKIVAVSSVSGFLFTSDNSNTVMPYPTSPSLNGTRDVNFYGYYDIPGLPPGNYTIQVEAIDPSFTAGSGLGPVGGLGIVFAMPSAACPDGEFFDSAESDNDICSNKTPIMVNANTTVTGKDIILNSTPPSYDAWEDGP
jgi:hypothetical protein